MKTPDLFDYAADVCARNHQGASTSVTAHESIADIKSEICRRVYDCIVANQGGMTCCEVEVTTGLSHQTASARISDLLRAGLIRDTGLKRPTFSGRPARVLTVTEKEA